MDGEKETGEGVVRDGKRQKVEGEELEAQLELKITANTSSRHKLEKVSWTLNRVPNVFSNSGTNTGINHVMLFFSIYYPSLPQVVQQLVEEQLRVLQLNVFDRSLQELRERVEKIDCATKHQQTISTLQVAVSHCIPNQGHVLHTVSVLSRTCKGPWGQRQGLH